MSTKQLCFRVSDKIAQDFFVACAVQKITMQDVLYGFVVNYINQTKDQIKSGNLQLFTDGAKK